MSAARWTARGTGTRAGGAPPPRRVVVLRPDNLGDVVLFSGAFRHLRCRYPDAEITLYARRDAAEWFAHSPHVDRVESWEALAATPFASLPALRGKERLRRLWRELYLRLAPAADVLLLPVRSPTATMHDVALHMPAAERYAISGDYCNQSPEDWASFAGGYTGTLHLAPERARDPELAVTRDFLRVLGCDAGLEEVRPEAWLGAEDRAWAAARLPESPGGTRLGVVPAGGSLPGKAYPATRMAEAIARSAVGAMEVVLFGTPAERGSCEAVARALDGISQVRRVTVLAGETGVLQLAAALARCDAVLATDTAALHIAGTMGRPTVGIMGGGHHGRFYPWGDPRLQREASREMSCFWCNWQCVHPTVRCVEEIPPAAVARELDLALGARSPTGSPRASTPRAAVVS